MPEGSANLAGKVVDSKSGSPVEYANVAVFRLRDSVMVTGASTNSRGEFRIMNVPYGRYRLVANFIGYEKMEIPELMVTPREENILVPEILLTPVSILLEGAEITADRAPYEFRIDKKVVSVDQQINAAGGTAADVLENTPSVEVDIEGNVSLRGSSNFTVLVNGRPSILEGSDALQQIPAATIKEIEIITNPSAKYDPEGTAGIINVITKKSDDRGMNGQLTLGIGTNDKYRAGALLNYRTPNYSIFGEIDFRDDHFRGERDSYREVEVGDTVNVLDGKGTRNMARSNLSAKLGMEYYLTSHTTIGGALNVGTFGFSRGGGARYYEYTMPSSESIYYRSVMDAPRERDFYGGNIFLQHKFESSNHQLDVLIDFARRQGGSDETTEEWLTGSNFEVTGAPYHMTSANEAQDSEDWMLKVDYVRPLGKGKMEAGWQSRLDDEVETYDFREFDLAMGWIDNPLFSSEMDFHRDIHSGYVTFSNEVKSFGYQLGLRAEYTDRVIKALEDEQGYVVDRLDWFPTVHLSQQLGNDYQIQASYTRRINRPRGWNLEPFRNYIDKDNIREGNPGLLPEYVNSAELSAMKKWGMTFLSLEAYYRNTENLITRILTPLADGVVLHTFDNINQDHSLGLEAMLNYELNDRFNFNLSGSVFNYRLEGMVNGETVDRESNNWRSRLNMNAKFLKRTRLQLSLGYYGPSVTAQGTSEGMFTSSLALRQDLMKNKVTAILQVRDIFGTMRHDFTATSPGYYEHTVMQRESQVVNLTLTYRINDYKPKRDREGSSGDSNGNGDGGYEY